MRIPVVTGPTASGKTAAVLGLAKDHPIEIISADAYQVYRHMDIGTAKASREELDSVPHHLIDVMNPDETYSAGIFFEQAERIIADVLSRGKIPVIAGGTGMYIESLQKGIFDAPDRDKGLRAELEAAAEVKGYEVLHGELTEIDPEFAANVKPADRTRIIRGLELNRQLGMNVKEAQKKYHRNPAYKYNIFVIGGDRQKIYDRINLRVLEMFRTGWPAEVKKLLDMGYDESMDSFKAIGYREIAACIREGRDVNSCIERIQTATRNFAKRQQTWFRHMDETVHIDMGDPDIIKILTESIFT
ncbi:tRNA (adenosine(37)-N6)-dimethylallyltransferase MiaA [Seleniivibrio woodruffii]|uniref:tRNA (adenosine(37)-N6)-dimethylallyltransferase MiaA n=1 Tax=Seleniivibrio woodruffii TaxID=1078050 RepID=UPI0039E220FC